jgi:hypothetical protein
MLSDTLAHALYRFTQRTPFRTFAIEFTSGDRVFVRHPETVFWRGETYCHIGLRGEYRIFDHTEVAQVLDLKEPLQTIDEMNPPRKTG